MARPLKQGLDYFPLDTDFLSDRKVRKIINACGPNSVTILICLLCNIYKDKGYYIVWDNEMPFDIADIVGVSEGAVSEVVKKALQVELFDNTLYRKFHILSSRGIQNRFKSCTSKRKDVEIIPDFWINDANNSINDVNNSINVGDNEQSKVNKRKSSPPHIRVGELFPADSFFDKSLDDCYAELKSNQSWAETVTMNTRSSGYNDFTLEAFYEYLKQFFMEQQNKGETAKSPKDAMSHFASWLKIELKNKKDERRTNKNRTAGSAKSVTDCPEDSNQKGINTDTAGLTSWIDSLSIGR